MKFIESCTILGIISFTFSCAKRTFNNRTNSARENNATLVTASNTELKSDLTLFHWTPAGNHPMSKEEAIAYLKKKFLDIEKCRVIMSEKKSDDPNFEKCEKKDRMVVGGGVYLAIDPYTSYEYGKNLIALNLKTGTKIRKLKDKDQSNNSGGNVSHLISQTDLLLPNIPLIQYNWHENLLSSTTTFVARDWNIVIPESVEVYDGTSMGQGYVAKSKITCNPSMSIMDLTKATAEFRHSIEPVFSARKVITSSGGDGQLNEKSLASEMANRNFALDFVSDVFSPQSPPRFRKVITEIWEDKYDPAILSIRQVSDTAADPLRYFLDSLVSTVQKNDTDDSSRQSKLKRKILQKLGYVVESESLSVSDLFTRSVEAWKNEGGPKGVENQIRCMSILGLKRAEDMKKSLGGY